IMLEKESSQPGFNNLIGCVKRQFASILMQYCGSGALWEMIFVFHCSPFPRSQSVDLHAFAAIPPQSRSQCRGKNSLP
ncbi:MAG: hypothetical protein AAFY15_06125, partial [Cyanobacteria bacterium J06648_11]